MHEEEENNTKEKKSNVINLFEHSGSAMHWTPEQMFNHEEVRGEKGIAIFLDTKEGAYTTDFYISQMKMSEALCLLEVVKTQIMKQMGVV